MSTWSGTRLGNIALAVATSSAIALVASLLVSCGGGGGASGNDNALILDSFGNVVYNGPSGGQSGDGFGAGDSGVDGSSGDGLPIVGGTVVIKDSSTPQKVSTPVVTDSKGYFRVKVTGFTPPLVATVTKPDGTVRNSFSIAALKTNGFVTMNITPLTSAIATGLASYGGQLGAATLTPQLVANYASNIQTLIQNLNTSLADVLTSASLNVNTFNPLTTPFVPDFTGYDFVLDNTVTSTVANTGNTQVAVPDTFIPATGTQPANLALALAEAKNFVAAVSALYVTTPNSSAFIPYLDANYLNNGVSGAANGAIELASYPAGSVVTLSGLAPYSAAPLSTFNGVPLAPAANVTYDTNNCVTSMWVNLTYNGLIYENVQLKDTLSGTSCSGGTWKLAGNSRHYRSRITPQLWKVVQGSSTTYKSGLFLETLSAQTVAPTVNPYSSVTISGPGITTQTYGLGTYTPVAATLMPASTALTTHNTISDPYYGSQSANPYPSYSGGIEGSSLIVDCANLLVYAMWGTQSSGNTPCLYMPAVVPGSDYIIAFMGATGGVLEYQQQRLDVAPYNLPANFYPTITSVTPAGSTLTSAGGNVSVSWTLPAGAQAVMMNLNMNDTQGSTLKNVQRFVAASATSGTINVPALPAAYAAHSGLPGSNTSAAFIVTSLGGMTILSAQAF